MTEETFGLEQEALNLAAGAGHLLLENGAEISRVEETMERIANHYHSGKEHFFVLSNGIFITGERYSNVEFIPLKGARMDIIVLVNQLSRQIAQGRWTLEQAKLRLSSIQSTPSKPLWEQLLGCSVGCAGFSAIFGGSLWDCAASLLAGTLMMVFVLLVGMPYLSKMLSNILGGLMGTALCMLFHSFGLGDNLGNMIVGTLIPLIPGVPFTNGLRDLANEDYLAGTTRLLDALLVFFGIALGVSVTFLAHSYVMGEMIQLHGTMTDSLTATYMMQLLASFIGTAGFAVLFSVPRRYYLSTGCVGMAGWMVYLLSVRCAGMSVAVATFTATMVVTLLSYEFARWKKCPSTVFLICGIFPMIPGAGVFWSTYYLVSAQMSQALDAGFTAVKVTVAIVLAIVVVTNILHPSRFRADAASKA